MIPSYLAKLDLEPCTLARPASETELCQKALTNRDPGRRLASLCRSPHGQSQSLRYACGIAHIRLGYISSLCFSIDCRSVASSRSQPALLLPPRPWPPLCRDNCPNLNLPQARAAAPGQSGISAAVVPLSTSFYAASPAPHHSSSLEATNRTAQLLVPLSTLIDTL